MRSADSETWAPVSLQRGSSRFADAIYRADRIYPLAHGADGATLAGGRGSVLRSAPAERGFVANAILGAAAMPDFSFPVASAERAEAVQQSTTAVELARERLDQQRKIREQAAEAQRRQKIVVVQIREANDALEQALRRTEPLRQAS